MVVCQQLLFCRSTCSPAKRQHYAVMGRWTSWKDLKYEFYYFQTLSGSHWPVLVVPGLLQAPNGCRPWGPDWLHLCCSQYWYVYVCVVYHYQSSDWLHQLQHHLVLTLSWKSCCPNYILVGNMVCNYQSPQLRLAAVPVLCEVYGKCPTASLLNSDWLHWLQRHLFFNPLLIIWLSKLFCVGFFSSFIVLTVQHCVWKKIV